MAAYGALVSLSKVIDLTMSQGKKYVHPCIREKMMSLHGEIGRLQYLLEDISGKAPSSINVLESRIRDVAYQMEDIIEDGIPEFTSTENDPPSSLFVKFTSFLCLRSSPVEKTPSRVAITRFVTTPSAFDSCAREIGILLEEAMELKEHNLQDKENDTSGASHPLTTGTSSSEPPSAEVDFNQNKIMDRIFGRGSNLEIIPITGMGGIGKTTLARVVYEHPNTKRHFDICCWVTVSQEFNVNEILRGLLPSEQQNVPGERLMECVHKRLVGRRYLIVLDDMWDVKAWDGVRNAFPNDNKGSRIILTTRLLYVAEYVGSSSHVNEMQFLNNEQSWNLLQEKVGGNNHWSVKLEDLGRRISRNCRGLPLAVVTIAGLLRFNMTEDYWTQVARDTKSETVGNDDQFSRILSLSYTNLPYYLKACFLYFGIFKEDYEIPTEELVRLWTAEGFLKPRGSKEMEKVAEEYLEELVVRNLVLVKKMRPDGRIKTCSIHDVLRDLSLRKAHEENFCHHITRHSSWTDWCSNNDLRRVSIDPYYFHFPEELVYQTNVRSVQLDSTDEEMLSVLPHFKLIRVLHKVGLSKNYQLSILYELNNLRYLHIYRKSVTGDCHPPLTVGESISKLQNLETLIFSGFWSIASSDYKLLLPSGIWELPRLRHLLVDGSKLSCPAISKVSCSGPQSLQTLTGVTDLNLTRCMAARISNLNKLKLFYNYHVTGDNTPFFLDNLVHLHQLEELTIASHVDAEVNHLSFPHKLKKLSLYGTEMPVEKMSLIGSLPHLEVLKLKYFAVKGDEWEPIEGEFLQLKYLKMARLRLKEWRAESEHFPQLETLKIKSCRHLKEVPAGIGEVNTLQKLILDSCKAAEESVEEIKAEQESLCNDLLQVIIRSKR